MKAENKNKHLSGFLQKEIEDEEQLSLDQVLPAPLPQPYFGTSRQLVW